MTRDTPTELARAYAEALESQADDEEFRAAQERLNGLRKRLERFEKGYGESDPATQELREKVQSTEGEVEELEREMREPEELENELLEAAVGFMLNDDWLQPEVIKMLNRALVGSPYPTLRVDEVELAGPEDAKDMEELARYDVIDVVRKLILDKLGEADDVEQVWRSIEGSTKEGAFRVVAESDKADPDDVMNSLNEDIERKAAKNRLSNAVYQLDINPYHREDGTYSLSTAGRYIAFEYARTGGPDEKKLANKGSGEDPSNDGQTTLVGEEAPADGGEANE